MDFYGNHSTVDCQVKQRMLELHAQTQLDAAARKAKPANDGAGNDWSEEFMAWVTDKARLGATFMSRTPSNP